MGDWIEVDGAPARGADGVAIDALGITLVEQGKETRASWKDVLGIARVGSTVYVLAPRQPPAPPWLALDATELGRDPAELARDLQGRSERAGYRDVRTARALLEPSELRARVLARDDVAGAVEVPARFAKPRPRHEGLWAMGGAGVGSAVGFAIAAAIHLEAAGVSVLALGAAGMLGAVRAARALHRPPRPRILVLAPDGIVASLDGAIRALPWDEIARIELARLGADMGVRITTDRGAASWIDVRWLDAPVDLVVAIAEAYRERWSRKR